MDAQLGRRALKKQRTHQAIRRTAMSLFKERGFDHVTTTEIAESAGVSNATLFNYFHTKEDLFFGQVEELEQMLEQLVASCQPDGSILDALRGHVVYELTAGRAYTKPEDVPPFHRLVVDSARLQTREAHIYRRREAVLARALTEVLGAQGPVLARVAAGQYVAAEKLIADEMRSLLAGGAAPEGAVVALQPFIDEVFAILRSGLGALVPHGSELSR